MAAAVRPQPAAPARPFVTIADRSTDPLANAALRGRVPLSGAKAPAAPAPLPVVSPPPLVSPPVVAPPAVPAPGGSGEPAPQEPPVEVPAPAGGADVPPAREPPPVEPAPPVRAAIPHGPADGAPPPAAEPPGPPPAGLPPIRGTEPPAAPSGSGPEIPGPPAGPADPLTATVAADGAITLRWAVPGAGRPASYVVSILGPDERRAVRTVRTGDAVWTYPAQAQRIDFGLPVTERICVRVRSGAGGIGTTDLPPLCVPVRPES